MATGSSIAFYYLNQSAIGGAVRPNVAGFTWDLITVFREPATNRKEVISEVKVTTLDSDTLVQIRDKLAAGVKAEGLARDFNVGTVVFFPLSVLAV